MGKAEKSGIFFWWDVWMESIMDPLIINSLFNTNACP